ncbi:MAG: DUF1638 domain-containing protein [Dethiobacteraceae bacterium]|jgi:hypothetical protein|nr:DUF1638 domain-containing protein [Bacillota bacterium]
MSSLVITCATIRKEIEQAIKKTGFSDPVLFLEPGLHNYPKKLHVALQELLDRAANVEQVMLVMGYCGNAVLNLQARDYRLIIPRADDCLTMLLGSQQRRLEVQSEKQTYFFSPGWLDHFEDLEQDMIQGMARMEQRYGKERALQLYREMFKHYQRAGLIDTGTFALDELLVKAQQRAAEMQLPCEVIPGTMSYLEKFLTGPWGEEDFIVLQPGEQVLYTHLFAQ